MGSHFLRLRVSKGLTAGTGKPAQMSAEEEEVFFFGGRGGEGMEREGGGLEDYTERRGRRRVLWSDKLTDE